tara:strand:+ start:795 stop:980 length:186 start_codon:yes stop_codon:yes gene_type:complete
MILIDQNFKCCSFCGAKLPPMWKPISQETGIYCSKKCIEMEKVFGPQLIRKENNPVNGKGK